MSNNLRGYTLRLTHASVDFVTETCYKCSVLFAITAQFQRERRNDHSLEFYCPNGHRQYYMGKTPEEKVAEAQARETAMRDQLEAAIRDAETTRSVLVRDRARFANGVCPCCNRSFANVRDHMKTKHPTYDPSLVKKAPVFVCSCGASSETYLGLRIHQGKMRRDDWSKPDKSKWSSHLTVADS